MNRLVACAFFVLFESVAGAQVSSNDEIAAFARSVCDDLAGAEGTITRREVELKVAGEASGIARLVGLSIGSDGKLKHDRTDYEGLPFDKVAAQMQGALACRLELARMLINERTRLAASRTPPSTPVTNTPRMSEFLDRTNIKGGAYANVGATNRTPRECLAACQSDDGCKAWTFRLPTSTDGGVPRCWLRDRTHPQVRHEKAVSGTKIF